MCHILSGSGSKTYHFGKFVGIGIHHKGLPLESGKVNPTHLMVITQWGGDKRCGKDTLNVYHNFVAIKKKFFLI